MNRKIIRGIVALAVAAGATPPSEMRISKAGVNDTSKGAYLFDAEAAKLVMAAYEEQGVELPFDFDHAMVDGDVAPHDRKAAGWFKLEVRETSDGPELWANDIRWTEAAAEGISKLEWRYISPAVWTDSKTGRLVEVINVAIVNRPATKGQAPIAASKDRKPRDRRVALSSSASFSEVTTRLEAALCERFPDQHPYPYDVFDDAVVFAVEGVLLRLRYALTASGDVEWLGDLEQVRRSYEPVSAEPRQESVVALAARPIPPPEEKGSKMKAILSFLGLKEDAGEADVIAAIQRDRETSRDLVTLTGVDSAKKAFGTVAGWREKAEQVTTLSARVKELETGLKQREVEANVGKLVEDGRLKPARREFAIKLGMKDTEMFEAFVAELPAEGEVDPDVKTNGGSAKVGGPAAKGKSAPVTLSADERKIIRLSGISEKDYLAAPDPVRARRNVEEDLDAGATLEADDESEKVA